MDLNKYTLLYKLISRYYQLVPTNWKQIEHYSFVGDDTKLPTYANSVGLQFNIETDCFEDKTETSFTSVHYQSLPFIVEQIESTFKKKSEPKIITKSNKNLQRRIDNIIKKYDEKQKKQLDLYL